MAGLSNFVVGASEATFVEFFAGVSCFGTLFSGEAFNGSFLGAIFEEFATTFDGGALFEGALFCLLEAFFAIIFFDAIGFEPLDIETDLDFTGVGLAFAGFAFVFPGLIFAVGTFLATTFLAAGFAVGFPFNGDFDAFGRGFFKGFFDFVFERAIMMIYSLIEPCEWKTIQVANWQGVHP